MARKTDDETPPRKKSNLERHLAVWLLLAMIVTGLGGWGVTNFGRSVTAIGTVGTREITTTQYARAIRQAMAGFSRNFGVDLNFQQAQGLGLDRQALQGLVLQTATDAEADRLGVSVGPTVVANEVTNDKAFQGAGGFDRQVYKLTLQQNGMTEREYEDGIRSQIARNILQGAVTGGLEANKAYVDLVYAWQEEKRGYTVLELTEASLASPLPAPTNAELKAYYDAHLDAFTRPAGKRITYAVLLPETLAATMTVDDKAVEDLYNSRIATYQVPEKRLVERLAFGSDDEAKAAKAALDAGTKTFEDLVKDRGLELTDIDMGDVSASDLGEAGKDVFALAQGGIAGPLPSPLGPALYRVNGVLDAQMTTLEQAKPDLVKELQLDAAKKAINDKVEAVDDALAGGATVEDLVKDQGMTLATTDYAPGADDNDPLAADKGFATEAARIAVGDYPEAVGLDNGGLIVMRADEDLPAAPVPLEKVTEKVKAAWHAEALQKALSDLAKADLDKAKAGASPGSLGVASVHQPEKRDAQNPLPAEVLAAVFAMAPGDVQVVEVPGWVGLVKLDTVVAAPAEGSDADVARDDISQAAKQGMAADVNGLFSQALLGQLPVTLDQAAINAVNSSIQ